jgi:CRP-like cAMP-binding protein
MPSNRILSRLPRADFALLEPHLDAIDLPVKKALETRKRRIDHVYFMESGFASVVANGWDKPSIEVGIIGREGMTGLAVILGNDRAMHDTYIQVAGSALRISANNLREADARSPTLHRAMLRYAQAFLNQTTTTATAAAFCPGFATCLGDRSARVRGCLLSRGRGRRFGGPFWGVGFFFLTCWCGSGCGVCALSK